MKIATLFSGFGGVELGARMLGVEELWGIDIDQTCFDIRRINGFNGVVMNDVANVFAYTLDKPDILHASPPCPNFSVANKDATETLRDQMNGVTVADFLISLKPKYFTLENVWGYRKSVSWNIILNALEDLKYHISIDRLEARDYQVPQFRPRMWVRAARHELLRPVEPVLPRVSWDSVIMDLWDTFKPAPISPRVQKWMEFDEDGNPPEGLIQNRSTSPIRGSKGRKASVYPFGEVGPAIAASDWKSAPLVSLGGETRRITPRAAARLMTFPDSYQLTGIDYKDFIGLGNAVPPKMYYHILQSMIMEKLDNE